MPLDRHIIILHVCYLLNNNGSLAGDHEWQLPLPALLSPGVAHRLHQTRCNCIIFRSHVASAAGAGKSGKMFPIKHLEGDGHWSLLYFQKLFLSGEYHSITMTSGIRFSPSLTAVLRQFVSE